MVEMILNQFHQHTHHFKLSLTQAPQSGGLLNQLWVGYWSTHDEWAALHFSFSPDFPTAPLAWLLAINRTQATAFPDSLLWLANPERAGGERSIHIKFDERIWPSRSGSVSSETESYIDIGRSWTKIIRYWVRALARSHCLQTTTVGQLLTPAADAAENFWLLAPQWRPWYVPHWVQPLKANTAVSLMEQRRRGWSFRGLQVLHFPGEILVNLLVHFSCKDIYY